MAASGPRVSEVLTGLAAEFHEARQRALETGIDIPQVTITIRGAQIVSTQYGPVIEPGGDSELVVPLHPAVNLGEGQDHAD